MANPFRRGAKDDDKRPPDARDRGRSADRDWAEPGLRSQFPYGGLGDSARRRPPEPEEKPGGRFGFLRRGSDEDDPAPPPARPTGRYGTPPADRRTSPRGGAEEEKKGRMGFLRRGGKDKEEQAERRGPFLPGGAGTGLDPRDAQRGAGMGAFGRRDRDDDPRALGGSDRERGPSPSGVFGARRDRDDDPRALGGADRERGPSPSGAFGRRDRDDDPRVLGGSDRERGPSPSGAFGARRDRDDDPRVLGGADRERGPAPSGVFGARRDRDDDPRVLGGSDRERGPSPSGAFGRRDRDDDPRALGGSDRERGPAPSGVFGARERGPSPADAQRAPRAMPGLDDRSAASRAPVPQRPPGARPFAEPARKPDEERKSRLPFGKRGDKDAAKKKGDKKKDADKSARAFSASAASRSDAAAPPIGARRPPAEPDLALGGRGREPTSAAQAAGRARGAAAPAEPARRSRDAAPDARLAARPLPGGRGKGAFTIHQGLDFDRKLDLIGVALIGFALVAFFSVVPSVSLGLLPEPHSGLTGALDRLLGQLFGWGKLIWPVIAFAAGVWLMMKSFERSGIELNFMRLVGGMMLYACVLTWLHMLSLVDDTAPTVEAFRPISYELAMEQQRGGGWVGHQIYLFLLGQLLDWGTVSVLVAWLIMSLMLTFNLSVVELWTRLTLGLAGLRLSPEERARKREARAVLKAGRVEAQRPGAEGVALAAGVAVGAAAGKRASGSPAAATPPTADEASRPAPRITRRGAMAADESAAASEGPGREDRPMLPGMADKPAPVAEAAAEQPARQPLPPASGPATAGTDAEGAARPHRPLPGGSEPPLPSGTLRRGGPPVGRELGDERPDRAAARPDTAGGPERVPFARTVAASEDGAERPLLPLPARRRSPESPMSAPGEEDAGPEAGPGRGGRFGRFLRRGRAAEGEEEGAPAGEAVLPTALPASEASAAEPPAAPRRRFGLLGRRAPEGEEISPPGAPTAPTDTPAARLEDQSAARRRLPFGRRPREAEAISESGAEQTAAGSPDAPGARGRLPLVRGPLERAPRDAEAISENGAEQKAADSPAAPGEGGRPPFVRSPLERAPRDAEETAGSGAEQKTVETPGAPGEGGRLPFVRGPLERAPREAEAISESGAEQKTVGSPDAPGERGRLPFVRSPLERAPREAEATSESGAEQKAAGSPDAPGERGRPPFIRGPLERAPREAEATSESGAEQKTAGSPDAPGARGRLPFVRSPLERAPRDSEPRRAPAEPAPLTPSAPDEGRRSEGGGLGAAAAAAGALGAAALLGRALNRDQSGDDEPLRVLPPDESVPADQAIARAPLHGATPPAAPREAGPRSPRPIPPAADEAPASARQDDAPPFSERMARPAHPELLRRREQLEGRSPRAVPGAPPLERKPPADEPAPTSRAEPLPAAALEPEPDPGPTRKAPPAPLADARPVAPAPRDAAKAGPPPAERAVPPVMRRPTPPPPPRSSGPVVVAGTGSSAPERRAAAPAPRQIAYELPDFHKLLKRGEERRVNDDVLLDKARVIEDTLASFSAPGKVVEVNPGPVITQFGIEPDYLITRSGKKQRVKVGAIARLDADLALALAAKSIRIEAPVPGKSMVGIEVPNDEVALVSLLDIMEAPEFTRIESSLRLALGLGVDGTPVAADLTVMPHLLIAGTTGSGKSVCVNAVIACLLLQNTPDDVQFIMVDPKRVELTSYNGIPHLVAPVVVDLERIVGVLQWVQREMESRYHKFAGIGARNILDYNKKISPDQRRMPYYVVVIDELADLMMLAPDETERLLARLAQMARATGIHLIISTQRPSVDIITGLIKANFPARIAFMVASSVDSRVILDQPGAEKLLGRGDMLFQSPDAAAPQRMQGVYVSDEEIARITGFWRTQLVQKAGSDGLALPGRELALGADEGRGARAGRRPSQPPAQQAALWESEEISDADGDGEDDLYDQAVDLVKSLRKASISLLQRQLRIGYTRAARLIDQMEEDGIIGPAQEGSKPREVIKYD
jgi:DNA segregation ATPase FtsK/SpoIIIE-like protein